MRTAVPAAPSTESRLERQLIRQVDQLVEDANELLGAELELPPSTSASMTMAAALLASISSTALTRVEQLDKRDRTKARRLASVHGAAVGLSHRDLVAITGEVGGDGAGGAGGGVGMDGAAVAEGAVCCGDGASGGKVSDSIERGCDP